MPCKFVILCKSIIPFQKRTHSCGSKDVNTASFNNDAGFCVLVLLCGLCA